MVLSLEYITKHHLSPGFPNLELNLILFENVTNVSEIDQYVRQPTEITPTPPSSVPSPSTTIPSQLTVSSSSPSSSSEGVSSESKDCPSDISPPSSPVTATAKLLTEGLHIFINPTLIVSSRHVSHAVYRALDREAKGCMKCKSVFTETFLSLTSCQQITDCLALFGVTVEVPRVLVAVVTPISEGIHPNVESVCGFVRGVQSDSRLLGTRGVFDEDALNNHLKCSKEEIRLPGGLEAALLNRIGVKGL